MKCILSLCFLAVILLNSCTKDYLGTEPTGAVLAENAFKSPADFESALNGCYSSLQDVGYYGRNFPVIGEILADNVKPSSKNLSRFTDLYNLTQTPSDQYLKEFWRAGYATIHRCNTLITAVKQDSVLLTEDERNKYLGQALGLRGMAHFNLFQVFSPRYDAATAKETRSIPMVLDSTFNEGIVPVKNSIASVLMAQIKSDLKQSRILLAKETFSPLYFSSYAAMALNARISLYCGDYISAAYYSDSLINNRDFSLLTRKNYIASWSQKTNSESIFSISFNETDNRGTESFYYLYSEKGYGDIIPTADINSQFTVYDVRKSLIKNGFCAKYQNSENSAGETNFPVIRISEMYLTSAESFVRIILSGNKLLQDKFAIINLDAIRNRATDSSIVTHTHGQELLNSILAERRKELCFEGQRFFDLKRQSAAIKRYDCSSQNCFINYESSADRYTMPIPISEINTNKNIIQNEGY